MDSQDTVLPSICVVNGRCDTLALTHSTNWNFTGDISRWTCSCFIRFVFEKKVSLVGTTSGLSLVWFWI